MTRELAHRILDASRYLPTGCIIARPAGVEVWPTLLTLEDLETIIAHEAAHGGPNAAANIAMARQVMEVSP